MASPESNFLYMPGIFIGFLFILQIKFRKSPFDLSMSHEIHQELVQGIKTEFSGGMLALLKLLNGMKRYFFLVSFICFLNGGIRGAVLRAFLYAQRFFSSAPL